MGRLRCLEKNDNAAAGFCARGGLIGDGSNARGPRPGNGHGASADRGIKRDGMQPQKERMLGVAL